MDLLRSAAFLTPLAFLACLPRAAAPPSSGSPTLVPALIEWKVGLNEKEGPSPLVEIVLPATHRGVPVWRIIHRDPDPTADGSINAYDLYDVATDGLRPIRSVMNREGLYLSLDFEPGYVAIEKREGGARVRSEVPVHEPRPEGPGLTVFVAALPLQAGFRTSFQIVDRWAADDSSRVKWVDLQVGEQQVVPTTWGRCNGFEVTIAPRDGSFHIRQSVLAAPPHYPLNTEYRRGELLAVSEVTRLVIAGQSACTP